VIFQRLSIAAVSGKPWEHFQLNHLVFAFLVAARFTDPIVSLPTYQFARDGCLNELAYFQYVESTFTTASERVDSVSCW
jgi:hypothetical protein